MSESLRYSGKHGYQQVGGIDGKRLVLFYDKIFVDPNDNGTRRRDVMLHAAHFVGFHKNLFHLFCGRSVGS